MSSAARYGPLADRVEIDPNKPQAFLSYARDDDEFLDGAISRLRVDIERAVGFVSAQPFRIFQDTDGIGFGQDWLDRLEEALRQARFLIPILTPRYFASGPCRAEAFRFLEYEAAAGRNDLILPIYLQDTPLVENAEQVAADDLARRFAERQYRDWRHLAFEPAGSHRLKAEATRLAREITDAAARAVPRPARRQPTPPDELESLKAELDKLKQTVEAERDQNHGLREALTKREQEAKQLAEERAVFEGRAEEATTLKRELDALQRAPKDLGNSSEQQPIQKPAGFRPLHAFGVAGLALLIGGGGGWLLAGRDANPDTSTAMIEALQQQIEALRRQVEDKTDEAAGFEAQIEELKGAGVDQGRITELTDQIDGLKRRLEASEQQATAQEDELNGMRWALAEAQTALAKRNSKAVSTNKEVGETFRDCSECPEMVVIPAGDLLMGSPGGEEGRYGDEGPQHRVTISEPFVLGKYEVTFDEWDACVAAGGCEHQPSDLGWGRGDRPVINVNWADAKQYCGWLGEKTDRVYRLPSEAEWEYAARAGTGSAYFWGDEIGQKRANCLGCGTEWSGRLTAPAGRFAANPFGLHDMHGNVREWVEDTWHDSYQNAPVDGSAWIGDQSSLRVVRGGSWYGNARHVRSAYRNGNEPGFRDDGLGFRCAGVQEPAGG